MSAALTSGIISAAFAAIANPYVQAIAKVAVGCIQGRSSGNCGRVAEAEVFSLFVSGPNGGGGDTGVWSTAVSTVEAGVVGGIASKIAGGTFNNGFSNAAGAYLGADLAGHVQIGQDDQGGLGSPDGEAKPGGPITAKISQDLTNLRADPSTGLALYEDFIQNLSYLTGHEEALAFYRDNDGGDYRAEFYEGGTDVRIRTLPDLNRSDEDLVLLEHTHPVNFCDDMRCGIVKFAFPEWYSEQSTTNFDSNTANLYPRAYMAIAMRRWTTQKYEIVYYGATAGYPWP